MVRQIAPVFFTMDIPATLAYYTGKLGFACLGTWQDPPVYAIVARDQQVIHFRGTDGKFPLLRKPPIVMSQTSLVKQTSESVPSVLGLPVRARRWRTILLPEQPP